MKTLFNRIQKQLGKQEEAPKPMQRRLEEMMRTKTGKAAEGTGPKQSALGEAAAIEEAKTGISAQGLQGKLKAQQFGVQEQAQREAIGRKEEQLASEKRMGELGLATQKLGAEAKIASAEELANMSREEKSRYQTTLINNKAEMGLIELASSRNVALDNIFSNYARQNLELGYRKDAVDLEQIAFQLALADEKYINEIKSIAAESDLQNEIAFKKETSTLIFGEELSNYMDELDFKVHQDISDDAFNRSLATIDINSALEMAKMEAKAEASSTMYKGASTAAQGAEDYYSGLPEKSSAPSTAQPTNTANSINVGSPIYQSGGDVDYNPATGTTTGTQ